MIKKIFQNIVILLCILLIPSSILAAGKTEIEVGERLSLRANQGIGAFDYAWTVKNSNDEILDVIRSQNFEFTFLEIGNFTINLQSVDQKTSDVKNTVIDVEVVSPGSSSFSGSFQNGEGNEIITIPPADENGVIHLPPEGGDVTFSLLDIPEDFEEFRVNRNLAADSDGDSDGRNDIDNINDRSFLLGTPYKTFYTPTADEINAEVVLRRTNAQTLVFPFTIVFDGVKVEDTTSVIAKLSTIPQANTNKKVTINGESGYVFFDPSRSVGDIIEYRIDTNIFIDSNNDGDPGNDVDNISDPSLKTGQIFAYKYAKNDARNHIAQLTVVTKNLKGSQVQRQIAFNAIDALTADFELEFEKITVGNSINFYSLSGSPDTDSKLIHRWDFNGDGKFEIETQSYEAAAIYDDRGVFDVVLEVEDLNTGEVATSSKQVQVINENDIIGSIQPTIPNFDFTIDQNTVSFQDRTVVSFDLANKELIYDWDFGDGNTSNEASPEHQYSEVGEYVVILTVTDSSGENLTKTSIVTIETVNTPNENEQNNNPPEENVDENDEENVIDENPVEQEPVENTTNERSLFMSILVWLVYFILFLLFLVLCFIIGGVILMKVKHPDFTFREAFDEFRENLLQKVQNNGQAPDTPSNTVTAKPITLDDDDDGIEIVSTPKGPEDDSPQNQDGPTPDWLKNDSMETDTSDVEEVTSPESNNEKNDDVDDLFGDDIFGEKNTSNETKKDSADKKSNADDLFDDDIFGDMTKDSVKENSKDKNALDSQKNDAESNSSSDELDDLFGDDIFGETPDNSKEEENTKEPQKNEDSSIATDNNNPLDNDDIFSDDIFGENKDEKKDSKENSKNTEVTPPVINTNNNLEDTNNFSSDADTEDFDDLFADDKEEKKDNANNKHTGEASLNIEKNVSDTNMNNVNVDETLSDKSDSKKSEEKVEQKETKAINDTSQKEDDDDDFDDLFGDDLFGDDSEKEGNESGETSTTATEDEVNDLFKDSFQNESTENSVNDSQDKTEDSDILTPVDKTEVENALGSNDVNNPADTHNTQEVNPGTDISNTLDPSQFSQQNTQNSHTSENMISNNPADVNSQNFSQNSQNQNMYNNQTDYYNNYYSGYNQQHYNNQNGYYQQYPQQYAQPYQQTANPQQYTQYQQQAYSPQSQNSNFQQNFEQPMQNGENGGQSEVPINNGENNIHSDMSTLSGQQTNESSQNSDQQESFGAENSVTNNEDQNEKLFHESQSWNNNSIDTSSDLPKENTEDVNNDFSISSNNNEDNKQMSELDEKVENKPHNEFNEKFDINSNNTLDDKSGAIEEHNNVILDTPEASTNTKNIEKNQARAEGEKTSNIFEKVANTPSFDSAKQEMKDEVNEKQNTQNDDQPGAMVEGQEVVFGKKETNNTNKSKNNEISDIERQRLNEKANRNNPNHPSYQGKKDDSQTKKNFKKNYKPRWKNRKPKTINKKPPSTSE